MLNWPQHRVILPETSYAEKYKPPSLVIMSYSANDNQNYFVASGRTTSRVVAQPGGQCSISIGGWTPQELDRLRKKREAAEQRTSAVEEVKAGEMIHTKEGEESTIEAPVGKENNEVVDVKVESSVRVVEKPRVGTSTTVSSNSFASATNTNSFNVITDRPTSRVTRPPGGHCSIVLG